MPKNSQKISFQIEKQIGLARVGKIHTPHGVIETPAFVAAATLANVKGLTWSQVNELGAEAALANTYHLVLQPGTDLVKEAGGLAQFMGYDRPTFTDSGGFQIMSLPGAKISDHGVEFRSHIDGSRLIMTPSSSMRAQHQIGADIHMAFDCPIGYGSTDKARVNAEKTLKITHDWAEQSLAIHQELNREHNAKGENLQALYGVVQGGEFADLRQKSAKFFADLDFDGYGIGGMYNSVADVLFLELVNRTLPAAKPRHWLGMGAEPRDLFVGAEFGCDTFDCVAPTRQARNGALYTSHGRINIKNTKYRTDLNPIDENCSCYTCRHHTKAYIAHLFHAREITAGVLASIHNEYFVVNLTKKIRQSLLDGTFQDFKQDFLSKYYKED
jgi:queuine tRNA-ribosyltransferase